jgi:ParB/RepB/Spo0J family partition protein
MTSVLLSKINNNPWRDLNLYPLDDAQVDKLVASIGRHGFFGGVRARHKIDDPKRIEIACGHHRIAAAQKAGLKSVDIEIRKMSDDEMIRLMISENAIQAGSRAAAIMNEVGAVTRRLAKAMLTTDRLGGIPPSLKEITECFQSQKSYETAFGDCETYILRSLARGIRKDSIRRDLFQ